jgi:hypothetical protein
MWSHKPILFFQNKENRLKSNTSPYSYRVLPFRCLFPSISCPTKFSYALVVPLENILHVYFPARPTTHRPISPLCTDLLSWCLFPPRAGLICRHPQLNTSCLPSSRPQYRFSLSWDHWRQLEDGSVQFLEYYVFFSRAGGTVISPQGTQISPLSKQQIRFRNTTLRIMSLNI